MQARPSRHGIWALCNVARAALAAALELANIDAAFFACSLTVKTEHSSFSDGPELIINLKHVRAHDSIYAEAETVCQSGRWGGARCS